MIKYLITIILTVALCCACDGEDFSADPTLMPPATQTGANTFGCLIDGWIYTGQRYGPDHKASYYPAYNEDEKATVHVYVQEERLEDGIVNITRFDLNNRIISGTFEGGRVTEGRFDLTF